MRYWKLRLRELKYDEDYTDTFLRWEESIKEQDSRFVLPDKGVCLTVEMVRTRLNEASKNLRKVQKQALTHRKQSCEDLLIQYEEDTNPSTKVESKRKAKVVRRTLASESCRRLFNHIQSLVKPSEFQTLSKIKVPRHRDSPDDTRPGDVHQILQKLTRPT